jgi:uroporphyrinogen-III synthase
MKKVLSTKTLGSDALAFAQTKNLEVECVDFIETSGLAFNIELINLSVFDAIAFTSANAVKYFFENNRAAALIKDKQVFALEGKTTSGLLTRGITTNIQAASADELADAIIKSKTSHAVLHLCGTLRLPVLGDKLKKAGFDYAEIVVYQTIIQTGKKVNKSYDAILFFSPSGVEGFMEQNNFGGETVCCCIGKTTAHTLKEKKNTANIILPEQPSPLSMLSAVSNHFQNHHQS